MNPIKWYIDLNKWLHEKGFKLGYNSVKKVKSESFIYEIDRFITIVSLMFLSIISLFSVKSWFIFILWFLAFVQILPKVINK